MGIQKSGKKWQANIIVNGKKRYLGTYLFREEADQVFLQAEIALLTTGEVPPYVNPYRNKYRKEVAVGEKFNKLTSIGPSHKDERGVWHWNFICDCTEKATYPLWQVISGRNKSCGCLCRENRVSLGERMKDFPKNKNMKFLVKEGKTPLEQKIDTYFRKLMHNAKDRGLSVEVVFGDLTDMWGKQEGLCAYTGIPLSFGERENRHHRYEENTASLDRISSKEGYTKGNIQWVHKVINEMKMALSEEEFLYFCKLVVEHHRAKTDLLKLESFSELNLVNASPVFTESPLTRSVGIETSHPLMSGTGGPLGGTGREGTTTTGEEAGEDIGKDRMVREEVRGSCIIVN